MFYIGSFMIVDIWRYGRSTEGLLIVLDGLLAVLIDWDINGVN